MAAKGLRTGWYSAYTNTADFSGAKARIGDGIGSYIVPPMGLRRLSEKRRREMTALLAESMAAASGHRSPFEGGGGADTVGIARRLSSSERIFIQRPGFFWVAMGACKFA